MEIQPTPAGIAQFAKGRGGRLIEIEDDVGGVARGLQEIDRHLCLRLSEAGGYFVVYWKDDDEEYMIFTAQELDNRIVDKMRRVYWQCRQPGYSLADELDKIEDAEKAAEDREFEEKHGELFQRLGHAMRKDLGYDKGSVFVPKDVPAEAP